MSNPETRKVTRSGGFYPAVEGKERKKRPPTFNLTLPAWWCRKHGYPTVVNVSEQQDGSLRVEVVE